MRNYAGDLRARVDALPSDPSASDIAEVVAYAHHRFQFIHPFVDTNGRTGRVLDLFLLWVTFGLAKGDLGSSPIIDPFPSAAAEGEYYQGLQESDRYLPERLHAYYTERILAAVTAIGAPDEAP